MKLSSWRAAIKGKSTREKQIQRRILVPGIVINWIVCSSLLLSVPAGYNAWNRCCREIWIYGVLMKKGINESSSKLCNCSNRILVTNAVTPTDRFIILPPTLVF